MSVQTLSRGGAALLLAAFVSGCSSSSPMAPSSSSATPARAADECKWSRSKCLYEGAYESGERDYAEEEAKRLNLAESARLRRNMGN